LLSSRNPSRQSIFAVSVYHERTAGKMGSTNLEVEQKVLAEPISDAPIAKDEEKADASASDTDNEDEPTFDTGLFSWLQVLGSFFLFFNSWYVVPSRCFRDAISMC
jgi:hypothetical protein